MEQKIDRVSFSRNQLKLLIAVTMVADHIGYMLIPPLKGTSGAAAYPLIYYILRLAGRLAFPLVCFFLVQGMRYTHDRRKYVLRMFLFALLSEIPFDLAVYGRLIDWRGQNVLFTLTIGLCVLDLLEKAGKSRTLEGRTVVSFLAVVGGILLTCLMRTDYSCWGILFLLVFYLESLHKRQRFWMMLVLCACQDVIELFAVASLFFTEHYDPGKGRGKPWLGRYFFYLFYPLHFLILFGVAASL